jgi:hypothetical protein
MNSKPNCATLEEKTETVMSSRGVSNYRGMGRGLITHLM